MIKSILKVFSLGGLKIARKDEQAANTGSRKAEALMVYLASNQRRQAREVLADMLWDGRSRRQSLANLRVVLSILRKHFGRHLVITRRSVALNREAKIWFDASEMEARLAAIHRTGGIRSAAQSETARQALQLYRGEFLQGFYVRESPGFEAWMVEERERLHHLAVSGLSDLVANCLRQGDYQAGIAQATRLLELDPLMESAHRQMMQLLALSGKRTLALRQYETLCQVLAKELAIEPDEDSKQLFKDIQSGHLPGVRVQPAGPLQLGSRPRHNLPAALTPLIGRESELAELQALLMDPDCRLVTLAGPGGVGKTRLASQAAEKSLHGFPHGAWFVRLDPLNSAEYLAEAIAAALHLTFSGQATPAEQLLEHLSCRELLLVLDNFEHLLPEGTALLVEILRAAPRVKILVTSREVLNLVSEWIFEVRGLGFPENGAGAAGANYPAVDLFIHHARRRSGKPVTDEDLIAIASIARAIEGMPLALELAAAWTRTISYGEVAAEIERGLGILQGQQADLPERHHSLRAVLGHSWKLLSDDERAAFARLSVFRGGFDRQAAGEVAQASPAILSALVDKSLLYPEPGGRYRIHELLRQYAAEEL